ncbi:MAG: hypothetical protein A2900_02690 [Candidatus Chisholmbacteria bacterium RIFCSPLOWO2_01_FULL_50_28]|uniref:Uncharacterized protein n=1 Tax=Candidatus Chisholmbacteria bacterium RIFCSPHIGHO2_01_FULL_52_32 TaxID=1797591 RepID=A0A1G1VTB5_9BACT|nr:MAG: hypothetical protein A2786_04055 [Candidatus Chisholmbacteria bacterium RIFCSPHIGHO2_01_FULL_52_32]OGY19984.1 MAG: hypothetical protein A2900_02690 [Candidatus Chisholmbacteria bacterium RIFCSPLOWO2_01_FULL_50_28]
MPDQPPPQPETVAKPPMAETPEKRQASILIKEPPKEGKGPILKTALIVLAILIAGVGTGYVLSTSLGKSKSLKSTETIGKEGLKVGDVFGNPDEKTFRDEVEGVLIRGGIDGEGSHHLSRTGGESQNVYLTSSVVDLERFVNHKVKLWGETFSAQTAGWLMDVGRVEILELNAQDPNPPEEE